MTAILTLMQIDTAHGCMGYSYLREGFDGQTRRESVLYLRGADGWTSNVVILPAETLRRAF